jgi:hypothetical protein
MAENKNFEYSNTQIPGDRSPWRLNFVWWFLIFVNPKLLLVALLVLRIFRLPLDFWKIGASLF